MRHAANKHPGTLFLLPMLLLFASAGADEWPDRSQFTAAGIDPVERAELAARLAEVTLVDVRSELAWRSAHIKGAVHVAFDHPAFEQRIAELAADRAGPLVFYCDDARCSEAWRAAGQAQAAGVADTGVYEAGLLDWADHHPDRLAPGGEPGGNGSAGRIPDPDRLAEHLLPPEDFSARVHQGNPLILDLRARNRGGEDSLFLGREQGVDPANIERVIGLARAAERDGRPVLIFDQDGREVRWLQPWLAEAGLSGYRFMEGGAERFFRDVLGDTSW